jgi:hypothetical protein
MHIFGTPQTVKCKVLTTLKATITCSSSATWVVHSSFVELNGDALEWSKIRTEFSSNRRKSDLRIPHTPHICTHMVRYVEKWNIDTFFHTFGCGK